MQAVSKSVKERLAESENNIEYTDEDILKIIDPDYIIDIDGYGEVIDFGNHLNDLPEEIINETIHKIIYNCEYIEEYDNDIYSMTVDFIPSNDDSILLNSVECFNMVIRSTVTTSKSPYVDKDEPGDYWTPPCPGELHYGNIIFDTDKNKNDMVYLCTDSDNERLITDKRLKKEILSDIDNDDICINFLERIEEDIRDRMNDYDDYDDYDD